MEHLRTLVYNAFDSDPAPIADFLRWLADEYALPSDLRLLDVGCGPGRMFGEYARMGWRADGLELDPYFCQEARQRAVDFPNVSVRCGGFLDIDATDRYDLIAAINSPFAYLLTHADQRDALRRCHRALRADGVLFLDLPNLLWFLKHENAPIVRTTQTDEYQIRFLELHEYDFHDARFVQTNEYHVTSIAEDEADDSNEFTFRTTDTHLISTPPELMRLLAEDRFKQIRTYNSYDARSCERLTGRTMLFSARRGGDE